MTTFSDTFRRRVRGTVLAEGDDGYDDARQVWNGEIDRRPALVVRVAGPDDVAAALAHARETGLDVTVRGGGHNFGGAAVADGALLVDLGGLRTIEVDTGARTARVGGGATWAELDAATQDHGLATPGGTISDTGVGGLTLGGGFGWLTARHGLSVDNLLSAEVVTADGRVLRASETEHPDLFWALRGGGGNFGVVTEFEFRLHPVGPLVELGMFFWSLAEAPAALRFARDVLESLPAGTGAMLAGLNAPPAPFVPPEHHGAPGVALIVAGFDGPDRHAEVVSRIRAGLPARFELVTPIPYTELQRMLDDGAPRGLLAYEKSSYVGELSDDVLDVIATHLPGKTSPLSLMPVFPLTGAFTAVPDDATAFGGAREEGYVIGIATVAPTPELHAADRRGRGRSGRRSCPIPATSAGTSTSWRSTKKTASAPPTAPGSSRGCGGSRPPTTRGTCSTTMRTSRPAEHEFTTVNNSPPAVQPRVHCVKLRTPGAFPHTEWRAPVSVTRRTLLTTAAGAAVAVGASTSPAASAASLDASDQASVTRTLRQAADYAVAKLRAVAPGVTAFPVGTKFEKWTYSQNGDWVGGFWPGQLWLAWLHSGEEQFKTLALASADKLAPRQNDTGTHDLGFLFSPSWVTAWRLTGDDKWRAGAVQAAASLSKRYNPAGKFIRAWGALTDPKDAGRVIMDTMMNLDLLAFASKQTGDPKYLEIAVAHAKTAQANFVRPDGSTPHVFDFDPVTGAPIGPGTVQGYSPTSCWSRGQAWGVYGFTTIYRRSGDQSFLTTAKRLADFALSHLTSDHVPVWDYLAPQAPNDVKDASAGVIMACGLLDLAELTHRAQYRDSALRILSAVSQTCLTTKSTRAEASVARCTRNRPAEDGVEVSLPYADYYLLEGILRVLDRRKVDRAVDLSSV